MSGHTTITDLLSATFAIKDSTGRSQCKSINGGSMELVITNRDLRAPTAIKSASSELKVFSTILSLIEFQPNPRTQMTHGVISRDHQG